MVTQNPDYYKKLMEEIENTEQISQQDLRTMVSRANTEEFIKNTPVALIPYSKLSDYATSEQIKKISELIGSVDKTGYDDNTLKNGYLVFQWDSKHKTPDLYVADPNSVRQKYARFQGSLPTDAKSREKIPSLMVLDYLDMNASRMPFFIKKTPTRMARATDLGIEGRNIQTSWGTQTVANGGYIVIEDNSHCYTVAPDANGLPIGYIKA